MNHIQMTSAQSTTAKPRYHTMNWHQITALCLVFFSFASSAVLSRQVFDRLPHLEDEVAYLFQARIFAQGEVVIPTPEPRRAFWQPFVVDYAPSGNRFGKYTPGYPVMLAIGVAMGQTWLVNALASALSVAVTFRLGAMLFNRDVGLIAAGLVAFSPAALLLNASLMGHTLSLLYALTFVLAYLNIEKGIHRFRWGAIAGIMLGMLVITRPLTALAVSFPFIVYSASRLIAVIWQSRNQQIRAQLQAIYHTSAPLMLLAGIALLFFTLIPMFNQAATGDPSQNLYELVWSYDRIGFGECCGRNGHTLEKAFFHARYDLSLTAADLFGWQLGAIDTTIEQHWLTSSRYYPNLGLSLFLLPFGVFIGLAWRSQSMTVAGWRWLGATLWGGGALVWLLWGVNSPQEALQDMTFAWIWMGGAFIWLMLPIVIASWISSSLATRYTWLLVGLVLGIVLFQMTYWIGSQRYSTRYYFAALGAASLLSALPLAYLARRLGRVLIYPIFLVICLWSFASYSLPRITVLEGFNNINQERIEEIENRRMDDRPILVLVTGANSGDDRVLWRAMGAYMVQTSPFLDSDIVLAWDYMAVGVREEILRRFPDRQIIEMRASGNTATFADTPSAP